MAKINIRAGDIPETDAEVEKLLEKMEKQPAKKRPLKSKRETAPANHEPGQSLPEDAAERAASGSGYQGEEITDAEWAEMQKASKPKPTKKRQLKNKRETAPAAKKPAKPKAEKPKAAKPTQPQPHIAIVLTRNGHNPMTVDIALAILADQADAEKAGAKVDRKALSAKYNIGIGTIADVLSGQPVIVNMLAKAGHTHPHPRDENGPRVGIKRKPEKSEGKVEK